MNRIPSLALVACTLGLLTAAPAAAELRDVSFTLPASGYWASKPRPTQAETVRMTAANYDSSHGGRIGIERAVELGKLPAARQSEGLGRASNVLCVTGKDVGNHIYGMYGYAQQPAIVATERDVWLKITGGAYNHVTGGSDGNSDYAKAITGDVVLELSGDATASTLIGGGLKGGTRNARTGNVWVAITDRATVSGNVAGAGRVEGGATGDLHLEGSATVYVSSLQPNGGAITAGTDHTGTDASGTVTGDTALVIDLPETASGTFGKELRGGSYGAGKGDFTLIGNTSVTITAPNAVTFAKPIYGGSVVPGSTPSPVTGSASVTIDGGTYTNFVRAGGWGANAPTQGAATLTLRSGVFTGTLKPSEQGATVGSSELVVAPGKGAVNLTQATVEGFGKVTLTGGELILGAEGRRLEGFAPAFEVPEGGTLTLRLLATDAELKAGKATFFPCEGPLPANLTVAFANPGHGLTPCTAAIEGGNLTLAVVEAEAPVEWLTGDDAAWAGKPQPKTAKYRAVNAGTDAGKASMAKDATLLQTPEAHGVGQESTVAVVTAGNKLLYGRYGYGQQPGDLPDPTPRDVWLKVQGGAWDHAVGGADGTSANHKPLKGDIYMELSGTATANVLIGGGLKGGSRNSQEGNVMLVIAGEAQVVDGSGYSGQDNTAVGAGRLEGGWEGIQKLTGNSTVRVLNVQRSAARIIAGMDASSGTYASEIAGNTTLEVTLPETASGTFAPELHGGSYASKGGPFAIVGDSSVSITAPNTVVFRKAIIGGSYAKGCTATVSGNASVTLDGGDYAARVTAGGYNATDVEGSQSAVGGKATLTLKSGIFRSELLPAYNGATVGSSELVIEGAEAIDLSAATVGPFGTVTLRGDLTLGTARLAADSALAVEGERTIALTVTPEELAASRVVLGRAEAVPAGLTVSAEGTTEGWELFVEDGTLCYGRTAVGDLTWAPGSGDWAAGLPGFKDGDNVAFAANGAQDPVALGTDVRVGALTVAGDIALAGEGTLAANAATVSGTLTLGLTLAVQDGLAVTGTLGGTGRVEGRVTFAEGARLRPSPEGPLTLAGEVSGPVALDVSALTLGDAPAIPFLVAAEGLTFGAIPDGCAVRWVDGTYWLAQALALPLASGGTGDWATLAWQDAEGRAAGANQWATLPAADRAAILTGSGTVSVPEGLALASLAVEGELALTGAPLSVAAIALGEGASLTAPDTVLPTLPTLSGEGAYVKTGDGTLAILPSAQTSVPLTVREGVLRFGNPQNVGGGVTYDVAHHVTVETGARLLVEWQGNKLTNPGNTFTLKAGAEAELRVGDGGKGQMEGRLALDAAGAEATLYAAVGDGKTALNLDVSGEGTLVLAEGRCDGWHNAYGLTGAITGALALRCEDRNAVTLSGVNAYTGGTELRKASEGATPCLVAANAEALGTGPVKVGEGTTLKVAEGTVLNLHAALGGAGTVEGAVHLLSGASLDATQGLLTLGTLTAEGIVPVTAAADAKGRLVAWAQAPEGVAFSLEGAKGALLAKADGLYAVPFGAGVPEGLPESARTLLAQAAEAAGADAVSALSGATRGGAEPLDAGRMADALACFTGILAAGEPDGQGAVALTVGYDFGLAGIALGAEARVVVTARVQNAEGAPAGFADGVGFALTDPETKADRWSTADGTLIAAPQADGSVTLTVATPAAEGECRRVGVRVFSPSTR